MGTRTGRRGVTSSTSSTLSAAAPSSSRSSGPSNPSERPRPPCALASSPPSCPFPFFVETWLCWCQDGKAAVNAEKLTLFRQFYMMVRANSANATTKRPAERCGCCCGTGGELHLLHEDHRVLVRLDAPLAPGLGDHCRHAGPTPRPPSLCRGTLPFVRTLPLVRSRIALCCDGQQLATFLFYSVTAYKFRPMSANPYLRISQEDEEELRSAIIAPGRAQSPAPQKP